jgi:hypothetical protein
MIRSISGGRYIQVGGGNPSPTYLNVNPGALGAGTIRFNPGNQNFEVSDGQTWHTLSSGLTHVALTQDAEKILDWARNKMQEEQQLIQLMEKNPGLRELYDQFEMMKILCSTEKEPDGER